MLAVEGVLQKEQSIFLLGRGNVVVEESIADGSNAESRWKQRRGSRSVQRKSGDDLGVRT